MNGPDGLGMATQFYKAYRQRINGVFYSVFRLLGLAEILSEFYIDESRLFKAFCIESATSLLEGFIGCHTVNSHDGRLFFLLCKHLRRRPRCKHTQKQEFNAPISHESNPLVFCHAMGVA